MGKPVAVGGSRERGAVAAAVSEVNTRHRRASPKVVAENDALMSLPPHDEISYFADLRTDCPKRLGRAARS